jgi:large subunit ribosomal protein L29
MKENADKARALDAAELTKQLAEGAEQMFRLRFQMSMGQLDGLKKLRSLRKERARLLTVERERELGGSVAPVVSAASIKAASKAATKKAAATQAVASKATAGKAKAAKPAPAERKTVSAPKFLAPSKSARTAKSGTGLKRGGAKSKG